MRYRIQDDVMDKLFKNTALSVKHLAVLDKALQDNYAEYKAMSQKLQSVPLFEEFCKELYAGGKKKFNYARQMILGDMLQYILTGRGYYFAATRRKPENFKSFVRILMYVSNLLLLMENMSVDTELRKKVLKTIQKEMGDELFCGEAEEVEKFKQLLEFQDKIIKNQPYEDEFDAMLPKRVGTISELLVYAYLIRKNFGYVIPLLQAQRLLGYNSYIIPPDFLLLRSKGEVFGIEVGTQKERQSSSFSSVTSIPIFNAIIGSFENMQPFRCGKCQKWILYSDRVIDLCAENKDGCNKEIPVTDGTTDEFTVYYGEATGYDGAVKKLRYHYNCVKDDPLVIKKKTAKRGFALIEVIPWVGGLEYIKEEGVLPAKVEENNVETKEE